MSKPFFLPQPLVKTIVSSYIELVFDTIVLGVIMCVFIFGLFESFSGYYGPDEEEIVALIALGLLAAWFFVWGVFKVIVLFNLRRQKNWAWIASLVIAGLNCFSFPYIILGVIKFIGLLNNDVMTWFKQRPQNQ